MVCIGRRSWPPVWTWIGGERDQWVSGEVGILREVRFSEGNQGTVSKCFLTIDHNQRLYMGCILLDDAVFARQMYDLFTSHRGRSIEDIGSLGMSYLL